MKLSIIVPCYNEQENVGLFYREATRVFDEYGIDYELLFINDGSRDKTLLELKKLCRLHDGHNIKIIGFARNFGKEAAIYAGLCECRGEYAVLIDADLQQRPETARDMLDILEKNPDYDCVTAYQEERNEGAFLAFCKKCFYKIINGVSDTPFVNGASDFRMMRRAMIDAVLSVKEYHRFSKGIFSWVGFETFYMPYKASERANGTTKWSFTKLLKYAIDGILGFTTAPLRFATLLGVCSAAAAAIYCVIVIIQKLFFSIDVPGYATIVVLILFLGGMQLFCTGILGEYISKIYIQSKERPIYIVKEVITNEQNKESSAD